MFAAIIAGLFLLIESATSQPSLFDSGCTLATPFRCLDGICRDKCTPQNTLMHFSGFCHTAANPYLCLDGVCVASYQACVTNTTGAGSVAEREKCPTNEYLRVTKSSADEMSRWVLQTQLRECERDQRAVLRLQRYDAVPLWRR